MSNKTHPKDDRELVRDLASSKEHQKLVNKLQQSTESLRDYLFVQFYEQIADELHQEFCDQDEWYDC